MGFKNTGVGVEELAWLGDQLNIRARVKNTFQVVLGNWVDDSSFP